MSALTCQTVRKISHMSLRIALLGLLSTSGPASGYDLTKMVDRSVSHVWHARHSQIYPELAKMAADGVITVDAQGPRGRKIYRITESGTADMREWLVHHPPSTAVRSEWALQAFLLPVLDPDEALGVLDRMRQSIRTTLAALEAAEGDYRARWAAKERPLGEYAFDLGLRHTRMLVQWVEDTEADVRRRAGAGPGGVRGTAGP